MKSKKYDVIIIGAGPAGSAAAVTLAKNGHSVLIVDQFNFPREKICGDGLTGDSLNMLKKLGIWSKVEVLANKSEKVELFPTTDSSFVLDSHVYTIKRKIFDKILLDYALDCGASFKEAKFTGRVIEIDAGFEKYCSFEFEDSEKVKFNIKADYSLVATGCQTNSHLKQYSLQKPDLIAVRGYLKADLGINHPLVYLENKNEKGYYWIFPMGNGEYNIGYGTDSYQKLDLKKKVLSFMNSKYPEVKLNSINFKLYGAFLRTNLVNINTISHNNILTAGEVLGATFPFTGEGIGKALETGILAAEVFDSSLKNKLNGLKPAENYHQRIDNELQLKYRPYRVANLIFKNSFLSRVFFSQLVKNRRLCDITSKILSDKTNHEHFSMKGILRYLLSRVK